MGIYNTHALESKRAVSDIEAGIESSKQASDQFQSQSSSETPGMMGFKLSNRKAEALKCVCETDEVVPVEGIFELETSTSKTINDARMDVGSDTTLRASRAIRLIELWREQIEREKEQSRGERKRRFESSYLNGKLSDALGGVYRLTPLVDGSMEGRVAAKMGKKVYWGDGYSVGEITSTTSSLQLNVSVLDEIPHVGTDTGSDTIVQGSVTPLLLDHLGDVMQIILETERISGKRAFIDSRSSLDDGEDSEVEDEDEELGDRVCSKSHTPTWATVRGNFGDSHEDINDLKLNQALLFDPHQALSFSFKSSDMFSTSSSYSALASSSSQLPDDDAIINALLDMVGKAHEAQAAHRDKQGDGDTSPSSQSPSLSRDHTLKRQLPPRDISTALMKVAAHMLAKSLDMSTLTPLLLVLQAWLGMSFSTQAIYNTHKKRKYIY